MARSVSFYSKPMPSIVQAAYNTDPRTIMAQKLMAEGSSTAPIVGDYGGLARLAQAALGAYTGYVTKKEYSESGEKSRAAMAKALQQLTGGAPSMTPSAHGDPMAMDASGGFAVNPAQSAPAGQMTASQPDFAGAIQTLSQDPYYGDKAAELSFTMALEKTKAEQAAKAEAIKAAIQEARDNARYDQMDKRDQARFNQQLLMQQNSMENQGALLDRRLSAMQANRPADPVTAVTVEDPNNPGKYMVIDGRTGTRLGTAPPPSSTTATKPPKDMRFTGETDSNGDPVMKVIPGTPTDKAFYADRRIKQAAIDALDNTINSAQHMIDSGQYKLVSGLTAPITTKIPNSPAFNAEKNLFSLKSQQILGTISKARGEAANGSTGYGRILQAELPIFANSLGNLDVGQSEDQMKENLQKHIDASRQMKQALESGFNEQYSYRLDDNTRNQNTQPPPSGNKYVETRTLPDGRKIGMKSDGTKEFIK